VIEAEKRKDESPGNRNGNYSSIVTTLFSMGMGNFLSFFLKDIYWGRSRVKLPEKPSIPNSVHARPFAKQLRRERLLLLCDCLEKVSRLFFDRCFPRKLLAKLSGTNGGAAHCSSPALFEGERAGNLYSDIMLAKPERKLNDVQF
jgi:hypothetical protein